VKNETLATLIFGGTLAIGMIGGGALIGRGLFAARASERVVTVKGLAEREVPANLAMWPIVFSTTGNDLVTVQATLDASAKKVFAFLDARGFTPAEYSLSSPRVTDREAQGGRMRGDAGDRYVAEQTVTLRSGKITPVKVAMQQSGELIRDGVPLVRSYEYNTTFLYTALDSVKPAMIAEATAREEGKPEQALPKIIEGRVNGFFKEVALLDQPSVTENKRTVKALLDDAGVTLTRFARFEVGS